MTCYAIGSTEQRVITACGKRIKRTSAWTTAAKRVDHDECLSSDAYHNREGRFGIGDSDIQVPEEISMRPESRASRFNMTRRQKALLDGPAE